MEKIKKYLIGEYDSSASSICPSYYMEIDEDDKDSPIPHFHIKDKEDENFDVALCFESANFFSHDKEENDLLCDTELEILIEGLNRTSSEDNTKTGWQYAVDIWNKFHNRKIDPNLNIPEYTESMDWIS